MRARRRRPGTEAPAVGRRAVRTVIAPPAPEVREQLDALAPGLSEIARRYIARLRLEPLLGHLLGRGLLRSHECRAVYFDRDSRPDDLFGGCRPSKRRGDEDESAGPHWRIVYRLLEAPRADVRVVQVLAVGRAHVGPGSEDVYVAAARTLARLDWRTR
jgi:hypothetical protein